MPLRIVIDVRRIRDFGIGTYIRNLFKAWPLDNENRYILVTPDPHEPELRGLPPNFEMAVYPRPDTDWFNHVLLLFLPSGNRRRPRTSSAELRADR